MTENISTIVMAFSALVTAGATIVLAIITGKYVRLTRQMLKSANTPIIRMFLHTRRYDIVLCVQNIGTGFARDVKFTGDLSFKPFNPIGQSEAKLEELEPFKSGIEYLGPGHKVERFLFDRVDSARVPSHTFDITATYRDLANSKDHKTVTFEIGNWKNTDQFGSPHTDDIANAIEKVAGNLEGLRNQSFGSTPR